MKNSIQELVRRTRGRDNNGFSSNPYATNLGAQIGYGLSSNVVTNTQYAVTGAVTDILSAPGNLQISGAFPQAVDTPNTAYQYTHKIEQITLGDAGHERMRWCIRQAANDAHHSVQHEWRVAA